MRRESIVNLAKNYFDECELYCESVKFLPINFKNGEIKRIDLLKYEEYAIRGIKDNKIVSSAFNSIERGEEIIKQLDKQIKYGKEVIFHFPTEVRQLQFDNYDEKIENANINELVNACVNTIEWYKKRKVTTPISGEIEAVVSEINIINTNGLNVKYKTTAIVQYYELILEGSGCGPILYDYWYTYREIEESEKENLLKKYFNAKKKTKINSKKMKVLFTPHTVPVLLTRLEAAISGKSLLEKTSKLEGKIGEKIFDERITIIDNPHINNYPQSRPFDDEGVPTQITTIIKDGVFTNFIFDLDSASKLKVKSTGNGYRRSMWSSGATTPITPTPSHLIFRPGDISFEQQIKSIDEGIILEDALGGHSGNIPEGHFAVNVGLGYYVKDGTIQGRVSNTVVSGNIYELFQNLHSISKELGVNHKPYLLFNEVSVASE